MPVNDGSNIRLTPLQPMQLPDMAREASTLLTAMRRASGGGGEGKGAKLFNPVTKQFEFIPGGSEKEREANLQRLIASQLAGAFTDGKTDASKSINTKLKKFGESSVERQAQIIEDIRRNDIPALAQQTGIDGQLFTDGPLGNLVEQQKNNAKAVDKTGTFDIFWDSIRRGGRTFADGLADIFSDSQEQMARANARQEYFKELEAENAYLRNRTRRQEEGAGFLDRLSGGEVLASMGEFLGENAPTLAATVAGGALGAGVAGAIGTSARAGSILGQAIPGAITGAGGQIGAVGDAIMSDPNLTDEQKQQALADAKAPATLFGGALGAAVLPVGQMARRGLSNLRANMGRGSSNVADVVRAQRAGEAIPNGALTWDDALSNARRADMLAENEIIRGGLGGRWRQQMADSMLEGMGFSGLGQIGTNVITGNDLTDNLGSAIAGGAFGGMLFTPFNRRTPYNTEAIPAQRPGAEDLGTIPPFDNGGGPRPAPTDAGGYDMTNMYNADYSASYGLPYDVPHMRYAENAARFGMPDYRQDEFTAGWSDLTNRYGSQRGVGLPTGYGEFGPEWGYYNFAENATDAFNRAPGSAAYWNQGAWAGPMERPIVNTVMGLPPSDGTPSGVRYRVSLDELSQPTPATRSAIIPDYMPIAGDGTGPAIPMRNYSEVNSYPFYPPATAESNLPGVVSRAADEAAAFNYPPLPPADSIVMGTRESGRGPIPTTSADTSTGRGPVTIYGDYGTLPQGRDIATVAPGAEGYLPGMYTTPHYYTENQRPGMFSIPPANDIAMGSRESSRGPTPAGSSETAARRAPVSPAADTISNMRRRSSPRVRTTTTGMQRRSDVQRTQADQLDVVRGLTARPYVEPRGSSSGSGGTPAAAPAVASVPTPAPVPVRPNRTPKQTVNDLMGAGGLKLNSMPRAQYMEQARAYIDNSVQDMTLAELVPLYGELQKNPKKLSKIRKELKDYAFDRVDERIKAIGRGEVPDAPAGNATSASRSAETTPGVGQNDTRGAEGIAPANNGNDSGSPANARSVVAPAPTAIAGSVDADGQPAQKRGDARTETQGAGEVEKTEGTPAAKTPTVRTADGERGPESAAIADAKGSPRTGSDGSPRSTRTGDGRDATNARRDEQSGNVLGDGDGAIEDSVAVINRDLPGRSADDLETLDFFDQLLRGEAGVPAAIVAPGTRLPVIKDIRLANRLDDRAISLDAGEVPAAGTALASVAAARQRALEDAADAPIRPAEDAPAVPVSEAQTTMTSRITTSTPEQPRGPLAEAGLLRQRGLRTNGRLDSAKVAEYLNDAAMRKAVANYVNDNGLASWGANDARVKAYDAFAKAYKMQGQPELEPYMRDTLDAYMSSPYPARKNMDDAVSMLKEGPTGAKQRLLELTDLGYCTITGR